MMANAVIFVVAVSMRVGYAIAQGAPFQVWEYEEIADNILRGAGYQIQHLNVTNHVFGPPLYPLFCAAVYFVTKHSHAAVIALQIAVSAYTCVMTSAIGRRLFNKTTAVLAGLAAAFHPGLIVYSARLHPFTLDTMFIALLFLCLLNARREMNARSFFYLGLVFGISLFWRSSLFLFLPLAFIPLFFAAKNKTRATGLFLITAAAALCVVIPWSVRNFIILKKVVLIQNSGEVFWRGNNSAATGTSYAPDGGPMFESAPRSLRERVGGAKSEIEQDAAFWQAGLQFIRDNPRTFMAMTLRKFYYFWWFSPDQGREYPSGYLRAYTVYYAAVVIFAFIGVLAAYGCRRRIDLLNVYFIFSLFISVSLVHSFFYVEGRHRWAVEPFIIILASIGLTRIWNWRRQC